MPRLKLVEGTAAKFWEGTVEGKTLTLRWGRIGTEGQTKDKEFGSVAEADEALAKLLREKRGKGYSDDDASAGKPQATVDAAPVEPPAKSAKGPKASKSPEPAKSSKPAKPAAVALRGTEGWRMPLPLAPFASGDEHLDSLVAELRVGSHPLNLPPPVQAVFTQPTAWHRGQLEQLLDPAGLDVGVVSWDQALSDKLEGRDRNAYNKRYQAIVDEQNNRIHTLAWVADMLARDRSTEGRVLDLALNHPNSQLRGRVAFSSLLAHGSPEALEGLTAALDTKTVSANPDVRMAATVAVLRTASDPAAAFDRLAPFIERSYGGTQEDIELATQVMIALQWLPQDADLRWRAVCARLFSHPELKFYALSLYARIAPDAGMEEALLAFADEQIVTGRFFPRTLIEPLGRCKDRRAALLIARGFEFGANEAKDLMEKLRAFDVAAAAPLLRASVAAVRKVRKDFDNPRYQEAEQLCVWLERNGAATKEEQQALATIPTQQPVLSAGPSAPVAFVESDEALPEIPLATQRKEFEGMLKEAKLGKAARKVLSNARVALCATSRRLEGAVPPGITRLGGAPDVPAGFEWPVVFGVPLLFAAQFDLAEIARLQGDTLLPKRGLLSFFVYDKVSDDPGAPDYLEVGRVFHFDVEPKTLRPIAVANSRWVEGKDVSGPEALTAACALTFQPRLQLPPPGHAALRALGLSEDELQRYQDDVYTLPKPTHQLLGYRTRDYDEQPEDRLVLLQLISDARAEMEWGDVDELYFYISRAALAAHDFTAVVPHCGD
jgi:predicted DNA-binding WGR domain protein